MAERIPCTPEFVDLINKVSKEVLSVLPQDAQNTLKDTKIICRPSTPDQSEGIAYVHDNLIVVHEQPHKMFTEPLTTLKSTLCHEFAHVYTYLKYDDQKVMGARGKMVPAYSHGTSQFKQFLDDCVNRVKGINTTSGGG